VIVAHRTHAVIAGEVDVVQRAGVGVEVAVQTGRGQRFAEVRIGGGEAAELGVVEAGLEVVEPRLGVELVASVGEAVPDGEARGRRLGARRIIG